jgi:phage terminase large subunit
MTKKILTLDKYNPRPYQIPIIEAVQNYKRIFIVLPRRSGKDLTLFSCLIDKALERRGLYLYLLPTIEQCRRCIFEAMTIEGQSFLGIIPKELLKDVNLSRMTVTLINGSKIVFTGYENYSRLLGANALGIVFSEWATSITPEPYRYLRPMVTASGGFAWFCTTPRSKNHAYDLFMRAKHLEHWWTYLLTVDQTKHVTQQDIKNEQAEDETLSDDMVQQEYYCSWTIGASGQFYNKQINLMRFENRLSLVAYDSRHPVYTSWDFGWNDPTCIIFFQYIAGTIRIFEYVEKTQTSLEDLIKLVLEKEYVYAVHIAPHDARVHEFTTGATRIETASSLGMDFMIAPNVSIDDGIHTSQSVLKRCYIDEPHCARLIKCLENYHAKLNEKTSEYSRDPVHDWSSHASDSFRYLAVSLDLLSTNDFTAADLEARYQRKMNGTNNPSSVFGKIQ